MAPTKKNDSSASSANLGEQTGTNKILVHKSSGLKFCNWPPVSNTNSENFQPVEEKIKFITGSQTGKLIAWIANGQVCVVEGPQWKRIGTLQHPKAVEICFSPKGNILAVWDIYSQVAGAAPTPNLSVYDVHKKKLLKAFTHKSHEGWQPQWTKDEKLMARMSAGEVHFYEENELENFNNKKTFAKLRSFSLSPSVNHHYCTFFVPSQKGAPAFVKLYKYPDFKENATPIASKSFFKIEAVESFWNHNSSAVLILTTSESDKAVASYYGEQMLFFLNTRGDSIRVTFSKQGHIRSVAWCPSGREFFCVYGTSPAKGSLFDMKCNPIGEFGEGARNLVLVNRPGNLVLLGGMGNISSRFEIWNIKERKLVAKTECSDITHMEWSPCGQYILTATCSPRLRVDNGFKIWHYTCSLMHESLVDGPEELLGASFVPKDDEAESFEISSSLVKGIVSQVKKASTQKYVPPSQRVGFSDVSKPTNMSTRFLSQLDTPTPDIEVKKGAKKQKKKEQKEEARKKKEQEKGMDKEWRREKPEVPKDKPEIKKDNVAKRKKNLKKKLESIEKLKKERDEGKDLDPGQLEKINTEDALIKEIEEITVS